jgi:hypothetical protein
LMLNSGDVVVMGGPSRLRFHGVTRILPGTAHRHRTGRFNLTFRQYRGMSGVVGRVAAFVSTRAKASPDPPYICPRSLLHAQRDQRIDARGTVPGRMPRGSPSRTSRPPRAQDADVRRAQAEKQTLRSARRRPRAGSRARLRPPSTGDPGGRSLQHGCAKHQAPSGAPTRSCAERRDRR